jgi:hypothetical protein
LGYRIETSSHAADDGNAGGGYDAGNGAAHHGAVVGVISAANDGDSRPLQERLVPKGKQNRRRVGDVPEQRRVELVCRN